MPIQLQYKWFHGVNQAQVVVIENQGNCFKGATLLLTFGLLSKKILLRANEFHQGMSKAEVFVWRKLLVEGKVYKAFYSTRK